MECRGIPTGRGMENRQIAEQNHLLEETGRKIAELCLYLEELNRLKEEEEHRPPTPADMLGGALQMALQNGNRNDAIAFADSEAFLRINGIESIQELQEKAAEMWSRCSRITGQIKQAEKKLHERQEMIRQAQVYRENRDCHVQYKKTKPRKQADFAESAGQSLRCMTMRSGIC